MVKVSGTTLIERCLNNLIEVGITKVIIVIGYKGEKLIEFIGEIYKGVEIEYVNNPIYNTTNNDNKQTMTSLRYQHLPKGILIYCRHHQLQHN